MRLFTLTILIGLFINVAWADPILVPDPVKSPGKVMEKSMEKLCISGYSGTVRNVSNKKKKQIFDTYGINPRSDKFEIDHRVPLSIGGSNDKLNLWPQSYTTEPFNAHDKDRLEVNVLRQICDGIISVEEGQKIFTDPDWRKWYCLYFNNKPECKIGEF